MGNLTWLFDVSLIVTIVFGAAVIGLSLCWWLIFKRTVRRFNQTGDRHAR